MTSLLLAVALTAQTPKPSIDLGSLLACQTYLDNLEFGIKVEKVSVAFPPENEDDLTLRIQKGGTSVYEKTVYLTESEWPNFKMLKPKGSPIINLNEPGDFVMEFVYGGEVVTQFPFTLTKKNSGDEFNPANSWTFNGPWAKMAYLAADNLRDDSIWFGFMVDRDKFQGSCEMDIKLKAGNQVVAEYLQPQHFDGRGLILFDRAFHTPGTRTNVSEAAVRQASGDLTLDIRINNQLVGSYPFAIAGGVFKPHSRSVSGGVQAEYLVPRRVYSPFGVQFFRLQEIYWSEPR